MLYLTEEEYRLLGGQHIVTNADLFVYQLQFDGLLFPNSKMIPVYYAEHGMYTAELKLAMTQYVDFQINNAGVLSKIPKQRVAVGTTGIAYGPSYGDNYGQSKYFFPPILRQTLKGTNLLSYNYGMSVMNGKPLKMFGTPWATVTPFVDGSNPQAIVTSPAKYNETTFDIQEVFDEVPTLQCEIFRANNSKVGDTMIAATDTIYTSLGTCRIQYEDIMSTEQTRGYSILPGIFSDKMPTIIQVNDMIRIESPAGPIERVIEEIHTFFDANVIHHHRVLLS